MKDFLKQSVERYSYAPQLMPLVRLQLKWGHDLFRKIKRLFLGQYFTKLFEVQPTFFQFFISIFF